MFGYTLIKTSELEELRKIKENRDTIKSKKRYTTHEIPKWVMESLK